MLLVKQNTKNECLSLVILQLLSIRLAAYICLFPKTSCNFFIGIQSAFRERKNSALNKLTRPYPLTKCTTDWFIFIKYSYFGFSTVLFAMNCPGLMHAFGAILTIMLSLLWNRRHNMHVIMLYNMYVVASLVCHVTCVICVICHIRHKYLDLFS